MPAEAAPRESDEAVRAYYDRVLYPTAPQPATHPDNLAARALLAGLDPAPPARCRVLELGTADGGNLIPMAASLPDSRFVGIDLSPRQIELGRRRAAALGLANLDLRAMSLLDFGGAGSAEGEASGRDDELAPFDYVIAHGIFSWVSEPVREKILAICRRHLAPHGVAYVSYNTWPGWHPRTVVREIMLLAGSDGDPVERARHGVELVRRFAAAAAPRGGAHAQALAEAVAHLEGYLDRPSYLVHEYLELDNAPLWFRDFAARAARHGLQVLGEADDLAGAAALPPQIAEALEEAGADGLAREQALDLLTCRAFRRTLLCHHEAPLDRDGQAARIPRLWIAADVEPAPPAAPAPAPAPEPPSTPTSYRAPDGRTFTASHPVVAAALAILGAAWPQALAFPDLLARVEGQGPPGATAALLADIAHDLARAGVLDLRFLPPACTSDPGERPRASTLALHDAAQGPLVTSQLHRPLKIEDDVARHLLAHLDGTRDRAALAALLEGEVRAGRLELSWEGAPVAHGAPYLRDLLARIVDHHLGKLARLALLVD